MLCFSEEISKWLYERSPVDIIYLDFQKAFDKVPNKRLLLILKARGIRMEQWLTDRRQRVVVDGKFQTVLFQTVLVIIHLYKAIVRLHLEYCV